jgi:hypothetical protein
MARQQQKKLATVITGLAEHPADSIGRRNINFLTLMTTTAYRIPHSTFRDDREAPLR